ncbi:MAG TPA: aldehyde dehydrogenase (NADP(+)) [Saprospiraceae bacterium]|nr:aldehyde dehydrogenase (NADP(+)) [Saprospiraceae bacterium]
MITQNIIGFTLSSKSNKIIFASDPYNNNKLPEEFVVATIDEVDMALQKATSAWRIMRHQHPDQRASFLESIADGIETLDEVLVNRVMLETAYNQARVLIERRRTVNQLRMFADYIRKDSWKDIVIERAIPGRMPSPKPDLRKINMPIGPVIVFAASNFPLAYSTMGGDSVSALAAGCPVIVKAHESHLGTNALISEVVMKAAKETGMPDGIFSSLHGDGFETGKLLVTHPLTAAVGFTGSLNGGRALFDLGSQREKPIPVFAEMGSVNPVFLLPEKVADDIEKLSQNLVDSITLTVGQFCTNPGIIVALKNKDTDDLIERMSEKLSQISSATMLNENIASNFQKGVATLLLEKDLTIVSKQNVVNSMQASPVLAKVDADIFLQRPILHQEVFGPFSLIVLCNEFSQILKVAESLEGQLTSTLHATSNEFSEAQKLTDILLEKAGRIIFNGVPTGVEVCEAMTHGGPYPASTDSRFTAVGHHAIRRWLRPVTFQDGPDELLPSTLKDREIMEP